MDYYKLKVLNNKRKIFLIVMIMVVIGGLALYYFFYYDKEFKEELNTNSNSNVVLEIKEENASNDIYVDIKGYVEKPGVYSFKKEDNARINDLILKAGGLKKDADTSTINLSKKLDDEMTVIIYSQKEINDYLNGKNELQKKLEICEEKLKNNACIEKKVVDTKLININTCSKEELLSLSGIGEGKAAAIIEYRQKNPFTSIDDLKKVDGIGESLFESIKNSITI